jgi:twitching motility protein PilT
MSDIEQWLRIAVEKKASDLILSSGMIPVIRLNGELVSISDEILEKEALNEALKSVMPFENNQEFLQELDYDFSFAINELARFRVNCFYQLRGPSAVFRIIPDTVSSLQAIGAPNIFNNLSSLSHGLILITGPTGSGKSTTMAAMIDYVNTHFSKHIITIEDPIEFIHVSKNSIINQREVGAHTHDFHRALRSALREDPDIILVGEMRDIESIRLAITAAETGHLVISTLHSNSAQETIDRLVNVFPTDEQNLIRNMVSLSLQAVIAQTLLKKSDGSQVAVYEIMLANTAIRHLIRENKTHQIFSVIQTSQSEGMVTRDQYIKQLISQGIVLL